MCLDPVAHGNIVFGTTEINIRSIPLRSTITILSFGLSAAEAPQAPVVIPKRAAFVEGKDYLVLERRRFLDEMRFDRPVERSVCCFPGDGTFRVE